MKGLVLPKFNSVRKLQRNNISILSTQNKESKILKNDQLPLYYKHDVKQKDHSKLTETQVLSDLSHYLKATCKSTFYNRVYLDSEMFDLKLFIQSIEASAVRQDSK